MDETRVVDEKRPALAASSNTLNMAFILAHPAATTTGAIIRGGFDVAVAEWGDQFTLAQGRELGAAVKRIMDRATVFGIAGDGDGDEKNLSATGNSPQLPPSPR